MMKIGFIDYYLDEWHAINYPKWIREASGGDMEVTLAYAMIDGPGGRRTTEAWCRDMGIRQAKTIEEVTDACDAIVVLSPDNCEMHETLCRLPLKTGKPVYVDKTFAPDYPAARRIFDIAESSGTPCYSTSALRFAEEYRDIAGVQCISSWGPNEFETYAIHQLEPVLMLMRGQPTQVMYLPGNRCYSMILRYADGRCANINGFEGGSPFMMNIATADKTQTITVQSDFFHHFIVHMVAFFRVPTKIVPHSETLAIMAVRGAGLSAMKTPGEWVGV